MYKIPDANYSRAIHTTLAYLDNLLTQVRTLLDSKQQSAFHRPVNHPSGKVLNAVEVELSRIEMGLHQLKKDLNLPTMEDNVVRKSIAILSEMWTVLCDTETDALKGFGPPPPGLKDVLDPVVQRMKAAALAAENLLSSR